MYTSTHEYTEREIETLWQTVCSIKKEAIECAYYSQDENAWCFDVVYRILRLDECATQSDSLVQIKSVQSQSIDHFYLPHTPAGTKIGKKADFAFLYSPRDATAGRIYKRLDKAGYRASQITDPYTNGLPCL